MNDRSGAGCLAGKVAWVTGSSRGIGRVVAGHLAGLGARVAIHGTTPTSTRAFGEADSLQAVASEMAEGVPGEVFAVHGDLTDEATVQGLCRQIRARFGQIDILVNNAGGDIGSQGTMGANAGKPAANDAIGVSLADIRAVLDRNVMTCLLPCREVAPELVQRNQGWIVNIGSIAGLYGHPGEVIYGMAKAAVHEYTRCLAAQLRPHNVHVNAIAPGEIVTPRFLASRVPDDSRRVEDGTLTRYGRPIEVARTVEFLVTGGSSYISGQVLRVDGGAQLWPA
jgi:3-oxoacyl-[acyl-carrier protein] reductase